MNLLTVFKIVGMPAPQGSKSVMPNGRAIEGSSASGRAKHKSWRSAVAEAAREVAEDEPHDGPLALQVTFRMPMPASRPAKVKAAGEWPKTTIPDLDKLIRALCDGLTEGGLIRDDARIFNLDVTKLEVIGWTGAEISLRRFEP